MLKDLIDDTKTDKNTTHSYLDAYEKLFSPLKYKQINILEIGIQDGGSIKLWHDYFPNANIYGIDIIDISRIPLFIQNIDRIKLFPSTNAYDHNFIEKYFVNENIKFDIIIDDGPHTLQSMIFVARHYTELLNENGILIIEDIQDYKWINKITQTLPTYKDHEVIDLRKNKNRYDDILLLIK
jgi:hypothetical protein